MLSSLTSRFYRRKQLDTASASSSSLSRCLSTLDLTLLGIGSTLGVGVYVLAGGVARDTAGPSVVLSFLIAGLASALSGLCYAEFGARVPRAGSAYVYSYVTTGELAAFIIGWNLILEYVIGTASVARGYSGYLDSLLNNSMKDAFRAAMPIDEPFLASYPDWTAFTITLVLAVVLSVGVKESTRFNNIFTILNLSIVIFVVLAGMTCADSSNWNLVVSQNSTAGQGGFFPYGFSGTLSGAATCFYGFVGFDAIATTGEETKNPQKSIPIAILVSLSFVCLAYTGISSTLTLMLPYYLQDSAAPLPFAFHQAAMPWAAWIVSIGALFGLSTSLLGAMFPLPRVLYAMASDGVIPRVLAKVHPTFQTPLTATLFSGFMAAIMALLFDLSQLVDMMSIGTLLAYTMVGVCVLLLRYRDSSSQSSNFCSYKPLATNDLNDSEEELFPCNSSNTFVFSRKEYLRQCLNLDRVISPTPLSSHVAQHSTIMFTILCIPFSILVNHGSSFHHHLMLFFMVLKMITSLIILARQPQDPSALPFSVPLVPWLPAASVMINLFLTLKLSWQTWIRFSVWMLMGFLVYGCYGWRNSSEEYRMKGQVPPNEEKNELKLNNFDQCKNGVDFEDF